MAEIDGQLTAERLRELLAYDPNTGVFTWRLGRGRVKAGYVAGAPNGKGYLLIKIDGKNHKAHRLAWLYMHGEWPSSEIDHKDRVKTNNRIQNLRAVTRSENSQNKTLPKNNTSKFRGVYWHKRDRRWVAKIAINGKRKHLGHFDTAESASAAYLDAAAQMHTHNPATSTTQRSHCADGSKGQILARDGLSIA